MGWAERVLHAATVSALAALGAIVMGLLLALAMALPALLAYHTDLPVTEPHPTCGLMLCAGLECLVWGFDPEQPGAPVPGTATCSTHSEGCVGEGPVAVFHVEHTTDILGFCVRQVYQNGERSDCIGITPTLPSPGGDELDTPIRREEP